jgi:PAS domain S-box-containing protein
VIPAPAPTEAETLPPPGLQQDVTIEPPLPESDNIAGLFTRMVAITSLGCLAYLLALLVLDPDPKRMATISIILLAGPLALFYLRSGRHKTGMAIFLWSIWGTLAFLSSTRGGLLNPALHGYVVLMLMAGWLLGMQRAVALWLASIGWIGVLTLNEHYNWWTSESAPPILVYWLTMACIWTIGFLVMRIVLRANEQRIVQVQNLNASLREKMNALAAQEHATRHNERRVRQILNASPLPITVAGYVSGTYVDVNPAWERTFGHRREDVIGKTSVDLGFWRDMAQRQGWIDQFSREGRVSGHEATFNMVEGPPRTFLLSSERFQYGEQECVLTMSVDVTERKRLDDELRELNAHLEKRVTERTHAVEQSNRELVQTMATLQQAQDELVQSEKLASLGSLVAGVAHELNTPLGNALVAISAMHEKIQETIHAVESGQMKKSVLSANLQHLLEGGTLAERSMQRAVELITGFKQVAVDQESERRRTFNLAQMLGEVLDTLRPNLKRSGLDLQLQLTLHPSLSLDSFPGPLGQVIINIVMNALNHAFEGRSAGVVQVLAEPLQGQSRVRVRILDDGVGIAPQHLGQIFDPFFTTRLGQGGSGLGLSISRRIVTKILGGQLTVQSTPGEGTCFEMVLPTVAPSVVN